MSRFIHPPGEARLKYPILSKSKQVLFASILGFGLGLGTFAATADINPDRPIPTKSGQRAALQAAASAVRQGAPSAQGGVKAAAVFAEAAPAIAAPTSPVDQSKIPHYFGPFPNWANSPYTLPNATVTITGPGTGATAIATVGANGTITGVIITNPGDGYESLTPTTVAFGGSGSGATATATVTRSEAVLGIDVTAGGGGYTAPVVTIAGNALATAYGGVDAIQVAHGGSGYTFPTVLVDFPDGLDGVAAAAHAVCDNAPNNACGTAGPGIITGIVVDQPGSGYSFAPSLRIIDGTIADPIRNDPGTGAEASATLYIQTVGMDNFGSGYPAAPPPTVTITDTAPGTGAGATATARVDRGGVTGITLTNGGLGYLTAGGIQKFFDTLPGLCNPSVTGSCAAAANNLGQFIPLAVPDTTTFTKANGFADDADYYVIALVQHRERMSSSLPAQGTLTREYVQLETPANASWSQHVPLMTDLPDGTSVPVLKPNGGGQAYGVTQPHFLGPVISANKDKPVRITFYNLLPTGSDGNLFIPVDTTLMGSGIIGDWTPNNQGNVLDTVRNPVCTDNPQATEAQGGPCFAQNRETLHLHGGLSPWISDGTPHQWITPADEQTNYPEGVSVGNVPDMNNVPGVPNCSGDDDGCMTFYYTNQQSARLMFYHDHAWGTTRLNVYVGGAAGYLINDPTEQQLISSGTIPADQIPLIIQDRTYVPSDHALSGQPPTQLDMQDPTWDSTYWGSYGDFWYHHVYMPAQNPGDAGGMSAFGRWMYGPWFWPPATPPYGPIANPYYNMDPNAVPPFSQALAVPCNIDDPATWQYDTDPFCEPPLIPGTPNIAAGMEQFNDTPIVNGTLYPTVTLEPKSYRLRILNAANDRFWNLQWYVADPTTASTSLNSKSQLIGGTEVALNPTELAAAQLDPVVFPTPVQGPATAGPDWIVIGSEGGFLPAPAVVDGQQPTTWITDPTRFDVGNVDLHSLLLAPAERADVIVDFSPFAGQTLILYNDAPAAFPARVPSYDYYTGGPDLSPVGAPTILPGYGPNTRTIMQVKIAGTAAPAFNLSKLNNAFSHKANGSGVFESGQHPIIVGQSAYNSAYGSAFAANGDCNQPGTLLPNVCDGFLRINNQGGTNFKFNTLVTGTTGTIQEMIQPKGIHDEMNSAAFDEFGRMTANMGLEVVPATPALQNIVLYPYINPQTELFNGTNLPSSMSVTPISNANDGTQLWKITHNGVDTHPLHFHLYDVQVLNRVTWDNIIIPPDPAELGWKETVRVSPLEDTIVTMRPVVPVLPWDLPNSVRPLNPSAPMGSTFGFNNIDAAGNPTAPITNQLVNYGWEYVWHCHILSHEEMDMMRPQSLGLPPIAPTYQNTAFTIVGSGTSARVRVNFVDNSLNETSFVLQRSGNGTTWTNAGTLLSPLDQPNTTGNRSITDQTNRYVSTTPVQYRVVAINTVGYGGDFMAETVQSMSSVLYVGGTKPLTPTTLTATAKQTQPPNVTLTWTNVANETGYVIERSQNGTTYNQIASVGANVVTYIDTTVKRGHTYWYRVAAFNVAGQSGYRTLATPVTIQNFPAGPTNVSVFRVGATTATVQFTDASNNETSFTLQSSTNGGSTWTNVTSIARNATESAATGQVLVFNRGSLGATTNIWFRVLANNVVGSTASAMVNLNNTVAPAAPANVAVTCTRVPATENADCTVTWTDVANNNINYTVQRASDDVFTTGVANSAASANAVTLTITNISRNTAWYFRVRANNDSVTPNSAWVNATPFPVPAPIN